MSGGCGLWVRRRIERRGLNELTLYGPGRLLKPYSGSALSSDPFYWPLRTQAPCLIGISAKLAACFLASRPDISAA
jgi:hypothetical protein